MTSGTVDTTPTASSVPPTTRWVRGSSRSATSSPTPAPSIALVMARAPTLARLRLVDGTSASFTQGANGTPCPGMTNFGPRSSMRRREA
jgi:hypothetical protein